MNIISFDIKIEQKLGKNYSESVRHLALDFAFYYYLEVVEVGFIVRDCSSQTVTKVAVRQASYVLVLNNFYGENNDSHKYIDPKDDLIFIAAFFY